MHARLSDGFTLIEVLVAILVLVIGVVGAAGVQVAALRTRHLTGLMSGGVQLAGALADRMRANSAQMAAGDAANPYLQLEYDAASGAPAPAGVMCFGGAACSSAQLAAFDLYEVKQALFSDFPGARVAVCRDTAESATLAWECAGAANAPIVIKLGWRDRRADPSLPVKPSVALVVAGAFP
ncbi:MAG: type IV pilus modification protein PilV [Pseudomonadota bacterium]